MEELELIAAAQSGDSGAFETLLRRYLPMLRGIVQKYYLQGADHDDLLQQGRIGFYKAVRDFKPEIEVAFKGFAQLAVTRNVISAIKTAARQKHIPLNSAASMDAPIFSSYDVGLRTIADTLADPSPSACDTIASAELADSVRRALVVDACLSEFECAVLLQYLQGATYTDTGANLGRRDKAIDNCMQRIRKKTEPHLLAAIAKQNGLTQT